MDQDVTTAQGDAATEALHVALDRESERIDRTIGHGREGQWIDDVPAVVAEALLRAGWQPPS